MSGNQSQITRHAKKREKNQPIETHAENIRMMDEAANKDVKK